MNQAKLIFVVPGFRQTSRNNAYLRLRKILKEEGYRPIFVDLSWKNKTISENVRMFVSKYKKYKSTNKYILGFSYGAMVAFIASSRVSSKGLILCSLSPFFKEDIQTFRGKTRTKLMTQRYEDFSALECEKIAKKTRSKKIVVLYGSEESRSLIRRARETFRELESTNKKIIKVPKTEHNIGDRRYLNMIYKSLLDISA